MQRRTATAPVALKFDTPRAGLQRPNTLASIASDQFAQKLLRSRRDIIARILAKEFITKPTKRRVIVNV